MQVQDFIIRDGSYGYLSIKVVPNASQNKVVWKLWEHLKVRIQAVPENGKANKELIHFLSQQLKIKKTQLEIISGASNECKIVRIRL